MPKNKNLSKITNYLTADTDNGILSSNVSQTITGSLTVTGNLTAQQFIVSSSVTYLTQSFASGSNIFGNSSDDTHQFTGSMLLTGSLTVTTTGTEFQVNAGGVNIGNALTDSHILSGSLRVNPNGLFVSSSGNVGIGTTSPGSTLDVQTSSGIGSSTASGLARFITSGTTTGISVGQSNNERKLDIGSYYIGVTGEQLELNAINSYPIILNTGGSERMRITAAGNVLIGTTTSNSHKLEIVSNVSGSALRIDVTSGSNGISMSPGAIFGIDKPGVGGGTFIINSSGNVGILTASPDQKLVINQGVTGTGQGIPASSGTNQNGILRLRPAVGVYGETFDFGMNVSSTYAWIQATNASGLETNYSIAINPNGGNVGIGNTSPSTKLHVTGTISSNDLLLGGTSSWGYTTDSNWSSHQLIIPSGALAGGGVYLIRIQYGSGSAPYIVYATGLWQPVQSNGGSADAEVQLLSSSHQGVGTAIFIRNQSVGGQNTSALYARLSNFPSTVGSLTATATRLM
jgi:hypothetical protein